MARITTLHQMVSQVKQRHRVRHQRDHFRSNFRSENRGRDQRRNYLEMNCAKYVIRKQLDFIIMFYRVKHAR